MARKASKQEEKTDISDVVISFTQDVSELSDISGIELTPPTRKRAAYVGRNMSSTGNSVEEAYIQWRRLTSASRGLLSWSWTEPCDSVFDFGGMPAHINPNKKTEGFRGNIISDTGAEEKALSDKYTYALEFLGTGATHRYVRQMEIYEEEKVISQIVSDIRKSDPIVEEEEEEKFIPGPPAYTYDEYEEELKNWGKGEQEWRKLQRKRWKEGYTGKSGVRLTGIHYFYLTQIKIKKGTGLMDRPIWRDVDSIIFEAYEECMKYGKDLAIFKRREVGLSSIFGAAIPIWTLIMNPGSTSLMTSADKPRVVEMYEQKFMCSLNELEDWIRPKIKKSDNKEGVASFEVKDDNGITSKNLSQLRCRQTSQDRKDATNLEGSRAMYFFIDELFLHPYAEDVRGSAESCLVDGFTRLGICVFGGSAGHISRAGLRQAQQTWADRENGTVECIFIPGTLGILSAPVIDENGKPTGENISFCVNGHSDTEGAKKWILKKREQLSTLKNKTQLASFIKRYPLTIEEVFGSSEMGALPPEIKAMVVERKKDMMNDPVKTVRCKIVPLSMETYRMEEDPNGPWVVFEKPIAGERYIMGSDPIPTVDTDKIDVISPDETELSLFGCVIKRVSNETYVAVYQRRVLNPDLLFQDVFGAQMLYNGAKNMFERNRSDLLIDRYRANGKWDYLADQPTFWTKKAYRANAKKGWYKGNDNTEIAYGKFFDYLSHHMDKIMFEHEIIDMLPKFILENTDILDAMVSCELYHEQIRRTSQTSQAALADRVKYREVPYVTIESGRRVVRYRKVPVFRNAEDEADYHARMSMTPISMQSSR